MSNLNLKTPSALASAPTQQTIQIATKHPATLAATVFRPDTVKAAVMIAPDDDIANDKNVADMIRVFPNMQATTQTLKPKDYGLQHIGHMKFFSRQNQPLWQQTLDWLHQHG